MNGLLDIYVEQEALLGIMEYWSNVFIPFINAFIKVGKMRPNYGLGIDDHTSFIRGGNITRTHGLLKEGLPFSPIRPTVNSAELGFFGTNYLLTGSISNAFLSGESSELAFLGLPDNRTIVLRGEYSVKSGQINGLIGGSYLAEKETFIRGVFGGLSKNSFTYTGEVDLVTGWSGDFTGLASFSEIAWVPRQGIHLLLKYDFFDENIELINNSLSRLSFSSLFDNTSIVFVCTFLEGVAFGRIIGSMSIDGAGGFSSSLIKLFDSSLLPLISSGITTSGTSFNIKSSANVHDRSSEYLITAGKAIFPTIAFIATVSLQKVLVKVSNSSRFCS